MQFRLLMVCLVVLFASWGAERIAKGKMVSYPKNSDDELKWGMFWAEIKLVFILDVLWFVIWGIMILVAWINTGAWTWGF